MERLTFSARLRLLTPEQGGRKEPIRSHYRPSWNLGNTWLGSPTINDGQLLLVGPERLFPGEEAEVHIQPFAPEFWGRIRGGLGISMQEGSRVVGYATILDVISQPAYFSSEVAVFVDQAVQFQDFIEKADEYPLYCRLLQARTRLVELYGAGAALPRVEAPKDSDPDADLEPPKSWPGFEEFDAYVAISDPYEHEAALSRSLSGDVLEVYRDVGRGLQLWHRNEALRSAAIWRWRLDFDARWGVRATDALRTLHRCEFRKL